MTLSFVYTLLVVTYGGSVAHSSFDNLRQCQEAKSLATTGYTIEENADRAAKQKAERERRDAEQDRRDAEWRSAHPPRPPKDADERKQVENFRKDHFVFRWDDKTVDNDGMILDWPPSTIMGSGTIVLPSGTDIRVAECVIETEGDKP